MGITGYLACGMVMQSEGVTEAY